MQNPGKSRGGEPIARKSFLLYASNITNGGIRWVTLAIVANLLGSSPLGMIAYAYAFIGFFQFLYNFGLNKAHIRRIADGQDPGRCIGAYLVVKTLVILVTTLIVFGAFGLRGYLADGTSEMESQVFVIILASIIVSHIFQFSVDTFTARREIARRVTLDTVANLMDLPVLMAIFFLAGADNVIGLAWAHLVNRCIWAAASVYLFVRASRHDGYRIRPPSWGLLRGYLSFSIPVLGTLGMATFAVNIDMVMVREFVDNAALGNYHVAMRVMMGLLAVSGAVMTLVLPTISRHFAQRNIAAMKSLLTKAERYLSMITAYAAMGMIVFAEQIVLIFGRDFTAVAPPIVRLFGIVAFVTAVNRPFSAVPLAVNRPWVAMKVTMSLMAANIALNLFLMPSSVLGIRTAGLGATGCALSTAIVSVAGFAWARIIAGRLACMRTYRGMFGHIVAATLVGALCYLLKPVFLTGGRWEVLARAVAMGVCALPVYCLLLASFGQFHRGDVFVFASLWNPRKMKDEFARELLGRKTTVEPEYPPARAARGAQLVLIDYGVATRMLPDVIEEAGSAAPGARIVLFRSRPPASISPRPDNLKLSEEYLAGADYTQIDDFSFGLAGRWHCFEKEYYPGMSRTGGCVEYKMAEKILQIVKDKFILSRVFSENGARRVVLYSGSPSFRDVAESFCAEREIALDVVEYGGGRGTDGCGIFSGREWRGIVQSLPDILEGIAFIRPESLLESGGEWCAIHDGSRLRNLFAGAGVEVADYGELKASLPAGESRLRRIIRTLPSLLRNGFSSSGRRRCEAEYRRVWEAVSSQKEFGELFTYNGMNFLREIRPYLEDLFLFRLPEIAYQIGRREIIYRLLKVRAIIVNDNVQLSKRIDIEAARRAGALSLNVQHGVCGESNGQSAVTTDLMAVWGGKDKEWYVRAGNPEKNIVVTGNPKFDIVTDRLADPPAEWRTEHCPKAVVFATQCAPKHSAYDTDDEEEVLAAAVTRAMSRFPDRRFVVKLHPRQNGRESMYREYARQSGLKNYEIVRDVELGRVLCNCELFITESSTAALEAVLWDVPIMIVNLTRRPDIVPYVPGGVAVGVYEEKKIVPALEHFFNNDEEILRLAANRQRFVADYMCRIDGNSTRRLYGYVEGLVTGKSSVEDAVFKTGKVKV